MAILTKNKILEKIKSGDLGFTPNLDSFQLQAHSVDLRLGFTFLVPKRSKMDLAGRETLLVTPLSAAGPEFFEVVELEQGQYFELLPQEYVLVSSFESVKIPADLMAILYPRSSTNKKGLSLDLTGVVNSGYEGQLTFPMRNNLPSRIRLYPGERVCQLVFEELTEPVTPEKSKYHKRDIAEGAAKEKGEEADLILKGDIKKLKADFKL